MPPSIVSRAFIRNMEERRLTMSRIARRLLSGAAVAAAAVALMVLAPGARAADKISLTMFMFAGANQGVVPREAVADYVRRNPNVEVEFLEGSATLTYPKMLAAKQTTPDRPLVHFGYFNIDVTTKGDADDMWLPLDPKVVARVADIYPAYRRADQKGVAWGIVPIVFLYNKQKLPTPPTSWSALWGDRRLKGRVVLADYHFYHHLAPTARVLGGREDNIDRAVRTWAENTDQIHSLTTSNDQMKNLLATGEAWIAPYFASIGKVWRDEGVAVDMAVPSEGAVAFPLYLQVVKGSTPEQARVAMEIINELLSEPRLKRYAELTYTPTTSSKIQTPERFANDPLFKPDVIRNAMQLDWVTMARDRAMWIERWDREVKVRMRR
jgi:putative spermidine/putrescine transport system substrate-binding protein